MKIIISIDSFKGCLSSTEACQAAAEGVRRCWPDADVVCIPVSDGGEGWTEAFERGQPEKWEPRVATVHDPLQRPIKAHYLQDKDIAIIEIAKVCGLTLLRPEERNPLLASTRGVGELLLEAYNHGCRKFVVGLGGSGTSDAGIGMTEALSPTLPTLQKNCHFTIATDVTNPLLGKQGAATIFGPQKGATPAIVEELEERARRFSEKNARLMGKDCSSAPGAGAAGGLGYAFLQFLNAERRSGAELLLETLHFKDNLRSADLIITGEGRADQQTLMGKLPSVILRYSKEAGVACHLVAGQVDNKADLLAAGFSSVHCINPRSLPLTIAMQPSEARKNIMLSTQRILRP